jgi:hypothetical protein
LCHAELDSASRIISSRSRFRIPAIGEGETRQSYLTGILGRSGGLPPDGRGDPCGRPGRCKTCPYGNSIRYSRHLYPLKSGGLTRLKAVGSGDPPEADIARRHSLMFLGRYKICYKGSWEYRLEDFRCFVGGRPPGLPQHKYK